MHLGGDACFIVYARLPPPRSAALYLGMPQTYSTLTTPSLLSAKFGKEVRDTAKAIGVPT